MVKTLPKISIIMNCYNGEEYLKESLKSILTQSYVNWELIFLIITQMIIAKKFFEALKTRDLNIFFHRNCYLSIMQEI